MRSFRLRIMAQVLPFLLITPAIALAQAPPSRAEAAAALNASANPAEPQYTRQQIDQLVAPIALYPDELLTQVLMAATYPQQVVEAAQWLREPEHARLRGADLAAALEPLPWEPSVKALVAFPQVIIMLSEHIEWTQALGVAFATQQPEVMVRVQALRHLAYRSGKLRTFHHLTVREEGSVIVIASAEPDRIFVPVYNPVVVYGNWPDREYPPVYIPPPPDFVVERVAPGIEVSVGYGIIAPLWGWSRPDWHSREITINRTEYNRITRNVELAPGNTWRHRGPVVLAAPANERRNEHRTVQAPHGTVAPAAAAAVASLPRRAAAQPSQIQAPSAAARTGTSEPNNRAAVGQPNEANRTATGQPAETRPNERNRTATGQPAETRPNERNRAATGQPAETRPNEHNRAATGQPAETRPNEHNRTATGQPAETRPGEHNRAATGQPAETRPNERNRTATGQPAETRPGEHNRTATGQPAETRPGEHNRTATGRTEQHNAAGREMAPSPSGSEPRGAAAEHHRGNEAATTRSPAAEPGKSRAARHEAATPSPAGHPGEARPTEKQPGQGQQGSTEPARQRPAMNAPMPAHPPEHAAGHPQPGPHAPTGAAAEHAAPPAAHETAGQGSSGPEKGPHGPAAGAPHEAAGGHAGRPEDGKKGEK